MILKKIFAISILSTFIIACQQESKEPKMYELPRRSVNAGLQAQMSGGQMPMNNNFSSGVGMMQPGSMPPMIQSGAQGGFAPSFQQPQPQEPWSYLPPPSYSNENPLSMGMQSNNITPPDPQSVNLGSYSPVGPDTGNYRPIMPASMQMPQPPQAVPYQMGYGGGMMMQQQNMPIPQGMGGGYAMPPSMPNNYGDSFGPSMPPMPIPMQGNPYDSGSMGTPNSYAPVSPAPPPQNALMPQSMEYPPLPQGMGQGFGQNDYGVAPPNIYQPPTQGNPYNSQYPSPPPMQTLPVLPNYR